MKKIITVLLTFLFLTNCGYTPIYSAKNFDFRLDELILANNGKLNSKIAKRLRVFSNQEGKKIILLRVDAKKKINTLSKNSKGNPSRYEMIINIQLESENDQKQKNTHLFQEKFNYNANANKFELKQYEKEIEDLLINKNIDRIIIYLSKV